VRRSKLTGAALLIALLAACGSSGSSKASQTTVTQTPTLPATTTTTSPPSPQQGTATPSTGLKDGQAIAVAVTGFLPVPKTPVGINECAQKGDASVDTPDCAIDHIAIVKIKSDGTGTATFKVVASKVGSNNHNCLEAGTRCFLSIGELSAAAKVERTDDIDLTFAP
jgi:hypothetical protein